VTRPINLIKKNAVKKIKTIFPYILAVCLVVFLIFPIKAIDNQEKLSDLPHKEIPELVSMKEASSLIAVGDIMLGRFVGEMAQTYGYGHFFEAVEEKFNEADAVFANLEGPIVKEGTHSGRSGFQFAFPPEVGSVLKEKNILFVSLANNHTVDYGREGYIETVSHLKSNGISAIGDPVNASLKESILANIGHQPVLFFAFNETYQSSFVLEEVIETIEEGVRKNDEAFIIVSMHWGNEYETVSSPRQRDIAKKVIDAGADLILGHHPHVVQEIGIYNGKVIFYSLGNFIFDQYFSFEVEQGLMVEILFKDDKPVYHLWPVVSERSRPGIAKGDEREKALNTIAKDSSLLIREQVKSGYIDPSLIMEE
jgi:gamma-polyglutamate biosynthesis protein CapA